VKIAILLNESLGEISFEYASNLGKKVPILLNESLGENGSGTGSALFYYLHISLLVLQPLPTHFQHLPEIHVT